MKSRLRIAAGAAIFGLGCGVALTVPDCYPFWMLCMVLSLCCLDDFLHPR